MAVFKLKTKNQVNIDKKPRVYFTCHPDDFEKYFDKICEDIFKTHDCAIYYTEDMSEKIAEDEKEVDLGRNNLFVVPITFKLLTTKNRTLDEDIPYALKKHIPVLPIMVESGIDEIYMRPDKFGEMQYLSMYGADVTAIAYEEKLKKYLESVLISDEMAKRVRAAFDAYIFLSYRKKDRKYANELMKLIHSNSECRDIAIWFDEFLIPGESFKETIEKMLDDCDLFTLLITPRLLEKIVDEKGEKQDNYVVSNELPLARKNKDEKGTEIFAVEMEKTDREGLATLEIYDYFSTEDKAFKERLLAATSKIAVSSNNTPEHDFLIGLAYLEGIDVEVNVDLAIELIMNSAEKGLKEALKKMVDIYYVGQSVPKCINKAASYQKKLVEILKPEKLLEDDEKLFAYLKEELYLAKLELDAGLLKEARNTCWRVIKLCRGNGGYGQFFSNNRIEYYIHAYVLLGDIFGAREDIIQSKECYDKAVKNLQELPLESRHVEFNYAYGLLYYKFGCIYSSKEFYDYRYIIESYEKAIDFFYDCDQQTDVIEKNVNYCLIKLAAEFERNSSKTSKAFDIYLKLSRICNEDNEDDSHKISIASYAFFKLGELYVAQKNEKAALESYEKSIDLANIVVKEFKNNVEVMKILLIASVKKIIFYSFIIFLYVHCFKKIKQMSSMDTDDITYAKRLIVKKYQNVFSNESNNNVCVKI